MQGQRPGKRGEGKGGKREERGGKGGKKGGHAASHAQLRVLAQSWRWACVCSWQPAGKAPLPVGKDVREGDTGWGRFVSHSAACTAGAAVAGAVVCCCRLGNCLYCCCCCCCCSSSTQVSLLRLFLQPPPTEFLLLRWHLKLSQRRNTDNHPSMPHLQPTLNRNFRPAAAPAHRPVQRTFQTNLCPDNTCPSNTSTLPSGHPKSHVRHVHTAFWPPQKPC
eukprot:356617-Chlamydomonas_euryale.AAC.3